MRTGGQRESRQGPCPAPHPGDSCTRRPGGPVFARGEDSDYSAALVSLPPRQPIPPGVSCVGRALISVDAPWPVTPLAKNYGLGLPGSVRQT